MRQRAWQEMTNSRSGKRARRLTWPPHRSSRSHHVATHRRARMMFSPGSIDRPGRPLTSRRSEKGNPPVRHAGNAGSIPARRSELLSRVLHCDPAKLLSLAPSVRNRLLAHAYAQAGYRGPR